MTLCPACRGRRNESSAGHVSVGALPGRVGIAARHDGHIAPIVGPAHTPRARALLPALLHAVHHLWFAAGGGRLGHALAVALQLTITTDQGTDATLLRRHGLQGLL